jgi:hypothetical protein
VVAVVVEEIFRGGSGDVVEVIEMVAVLVEDITEVVAFVV